MKKALIVSIILLFTAQNVSAVAHCTTSVNQVWVNEFGDIFIHGTPGGLLPYAGWQRLCNINAASGNVSVTMCAVWVSLARQALSGTNLIVQTSYANLGACTEIPLTYPPPVAVNTSKS